MTPRNSWLSVFVFGGFIFVRAAFADPWIQTAAPNANWTSMAASADGLHLVACAGGDGVYVSPSSGAFWSRTSLPTNAWISVASSTNGGVLAAAGNGLIYVSADSGNNWAPSGAPSNSWAAVAMSVDGRVMVAAVSGGLVYTSTNYGSDWTPSASPTLSWTCIACSADGTKLVGGSTGPAYVSPDFGVTWNFCSYLPFTLWHAMASSSDGTRLVAQSRVTTGTDPGQIYTSTNSGTTWTAAPGPWPVYWGCLAASSDLSKIVGGGYFGPLYTATNYGNAWQQSFDSGWWSAAAASADGSEFVAAASGGGIFVLGNSYPIITAQPVSQINDFGSAASFSVSAVGAATLGYQWQRNGVNLTDGGNVTGSATPNLYIDSLSDADALAYTVIVSNSFGSITSSIATLTLTQPAIQSQPFDLLSIATTTASFTVVAVGDAPLHYQWRKNGANLSDAGNILGSGASNLTLLNVSASDAGSYDVIVTNSSGSVTSSVAMLTVTNLGILVQPASIVALPRSTANFSVLAAGTPTLGYQWRKNGTNLVDGGNITGSLTANLSVRQVNYADQGNYSVVVNNNSNSVISDDASLSVQTWATNNVPLGNYGPANWGPVAMSADGRKCMAAIALDFGPYENPIGAPIYLSTNWGRTWFKSTPTNAFWTGVASSGSGVTLLACASSDGVYASTNSGGTWALTQAPIGNWSAVVVSSDGAKVAAAMNLGGIYTSPDSGVTWTPANAPQTNWAALASSADGDKLAAVVRGGGIYVSTDSGSNWSQTLAPSASWSAIASSADGTKLAATINGDTIYVSTDSGGTWAPTSAPQLSWSGIASSADGTKLAAGAMFDYIYQSTDSGNTWSNVGSPWGYWGSIASSTNGGRLLASTFGDLYTWPGQPSLTIELTGTNVVLSWQSFATGFSLFQSDNLGSTNWVAVPGAVNDNGIMESVTVAPSPGQRFFQLAK